MDNIDLEQQEPLPVDRDGRRLKTDQTDGARKPGCCERFQQTVSKWMLPEDLRSKYLERTNCCPPPIFIILISIGEVRKFPICDSLFHVNHTTRQSTRNKQRSTGALQLQVTTKINPLYGKQFTSWPTDPEAHDIVSLCCLQRLNKLTFVELHGKDAVMLLINIWRCFKCL